MAGATSSGQSAWNKRKSLLQHLKVRKIIEFINHTLQMKALVRVPSEEFVFDVRRSGMEV